MKVPVCAREADVVEAVVSRGWPAGVEADLLAHVNGCPVCQDVVAVAQAMRDEHAAACQEAQIEMPSAGRVWWRAELRARQEAARAAARPMTLVHVVAGACGLGAVLTLAGLLSPWARAVLAGLAGWVDASWLDAAALATLLQRGGVPLLLAAGTWMVLVPVALYFVFTRE